MAIRRELGLNLDTNNNPTPKAIKIPPPILGNFQAIIVIAKTTSASNKWATPDCQPKLESKPSKINMEKNRTIKIERTLGV